EHRGDLRRQAAHGLTGGVDDHPVVRGLVGKVRLHVSHVLAIAFNATAFSATAPCHGAVAGSAVLIGAAKSKPKGMLARNGHACTGRGWRFRCALAVAPSR